MTTTIIKTRDACIGDASEGAVIRFATVRLQDVDGGEKKVVYRNDKPLYDEYLGKVATYERINSRPYPTIKFTLEGSDREFQMRPDFHIKLDEPVPVHAALAHITETAHRWRSGTCSADEAADALLAAAALFKALDLRAFPMGTLDDERLEQVVVTIHGVEVSVRGRTGDMYVDVTDNRDADVAAQYPLIIAANDEEVYYS